MIAPGTVVFDELEEKYEVVEMIGNGSFGFVYKIEKKSDGSYYALKTLPTNFQSQEAYRAFVNECNLATTISHRNALKYLFVHNGDRHPDLPPYLIMEYADQGTLLSLLENQKAKGEFFSNEILREFFNQLIDGMHHINQTLVHRDIKADNVLIHDGVLKIATENTRLITFKGIGHIKYMAPERWRHDKNTIQNDIYSMGILFYELAALQHPYNVQNESDMSNWQEAHTFQNAKPIKYINSNLNNGMVQVINKMIEKNINSRYKNWDEIKKDLDVDEVSITPVSHLIENLVNVKVVRDESFKEQELKRQKEESERQEYVKRIGYQFKQHIYNPLKEYIDEFNIRYAGSKILLDQFNSLNDDSIHIKFRLPSKKHVDIKLRTLYDKDFIKSKEDRFGERRYQKLMRPKLQNQLILAWGYFDIYNGQGFNIILVEEEGNIYGKWYLMKNKVSMFYQKPSNYKEPCAIEFDMMEEAISHLNVFGSKFDSEIIEGEKFIEVVNELLVQNI